MAKAIRLGNFILENMESILQQWENFAKTINPPALTMDSHSLRDNAELMLKTIALDLSTAQTEAEKLDKSKGLAPVNLGTTAAEEHADERLAAGFSIGQLVSEYRALRANVLHLWDKNSADGLVTDAADTTRFNEAIDQSIAESVERFDEKLKKNEARYRTLTKSIDDGFCIIELLFDVNNNPIDYYFHEVNPVFEAQTGLINAAGKKCWRWFRITNNTGSIFMGKL